MGGHWTAGPRFDNFFLEKQAADALMHQLVPEELMGKTTRRTRLECLKIILYFGRDSRSLITDRRANYR